MSADKGTLIARDPETGQLLPGSKLGKGRPKGSKNKFSRGVLETYAQHVANGDFSEVMEGLKRDNPAIFAKLVNDAGLKLMEQESSGDIHNVDLHIHFVDPEGSSADRHTDPGSVSGALPPA